MSDDEVSEGLSDQDRRDMFALAWVVVTGFYVVAVILVVQNDWSERRWIALTAIAGITQAVAVSAALVVGVRQLNAHQRIARSERQYEYFDRIHRRVFESIDPAFAELVECCEETSRAVNELGGTTAKGSLPLAPQTLRSTSMQRNVVALRLWVGEVAVLAERCGRGVDPHAVATLEAALDQFQAPGPDLRHLRKSEVASSTQAVQHAQALWSCIRDGIYASSPDL